MAWIISIVLFGITSVCAGFYSGNWRNIQNTPWRLVKKIYDTYIWCVILIYIGWRMQGWLKGQSQIFENCNNGPEETPVQGDCGYILTPRATGAARPSPAGPECKQMSFLLPNLVAFLCNTVNIHLEKWLMGCNTKRAIWWDLFNTHISIFCIKHMSTIFRTLQVNKW